MRTVAVARHAMATRFEVVLYGDDPVALRAAGEEALDEIERLEAHLSLYRATSEISAVNARAAHAPVRLEPGLFRLLQHAQRLHRESGGAFDITVAPLVRCWGFMGGQGRMPDDDQVEAAREKVGMQMVTFHEESFSVEFEREGMMLDLGAIGKGYAVERAAEILRDAGVESALIHGGTSTVYAIGAPPEAETWKVALEYPARAPGEADRQVRPGGSMRTEWHGGPESSDFENAEQDSAPASPVINAGDEPASALAVVPLKDEAMSVSAPHGRCFTADGKMFGHVLDPRTGRPVQGALLAAVVLPSATETDALSTALLTLGSAGLERISNLRSGLRALVLTCDEKTGQPRVESKGIAIQNA